MTGTSLLLAAWWMIIAVVSLDSDRYKGTQVTQFHSEIKVSKSKETSQTTSVAQSTSLISICVLGISQTLILAPKANLQD